MSFPIFTIESGSVKPGAIVKKLTLKGASTDIPAILIGEEGRGRQQGVLPVALTVSQQKEWQEKGQTTVLFAEMGTSGSGKPKLIAKEKAENSDKFIAVFNTEIGYRGGNEHTGDRAEATYTLTYGGRDDIRRQTVFSLELNNRIGGELSKEAKDSIKSEFNLSDDDFESKLAFAQFPGQVIIEGRIAQGGAGNMGSGRQLVALMPKDVWFRTGYSGRLYGKPAAHYYLWNGSKLTAVTWDDRQNLSAIEEITESVETEIAEKAATANALPVQSSLVLEELKRALNLNPEPDVSISNEGNIVLSFGVFSGKKFTIVGGELKKS